MIIVSAVGFPWGLVPPFFGALLLLVLGLLADNKARNDGGMR